MPLASVKVRDDERANVEPSAVAGISAFLGKLWKMVEDPKTDHLISWGKSGNTFVIKNQIDFAKTILPNYYKHNNIASFIRQLNMYGFHKIISTTSGSLDSSDNDEIEFTHPCFVRGNPYLLEQIKRKMNNPKENIVKTENNNQFNESMKRVLNDIKNLKGKQEHLGSQLCSVKQENEILWRELSLLRQKHATQQNVLNKLIRFLVSLAQPSSNHGLVKRRLVPLMLKDSASNTKNRPSYYEGDHAYTFKKRAEPSPGTTIHEIHSSELPDDVQIIETPILDDDSSVIVDREIVTSPAPSLANSDLSVSSSSPEPVPAALLLPSSRKGEKRIKTVYLAPSSQISQHFLASRNRRGARSKSPEYLIPEQTDNPLLELVHDTELAVDDDDDNYVTIAAGDDGDELNDADITLKLINDPRSIATYNLVQTMKHKVPIRRRNYAKKESNLAKTDDTKPTSAKRTDCKKKSTNATVEENGQGVTSSGNEFLFGLDINNYTEPLIEVHTPSSTTSTQNDENTTDNVNVFPTSEENLNVPITVEDMMDLPNTTSSNTIQIEQPQQPTIVDNQQIMQTLSPNKQRTEMRCSPVKQTSIAFTGAENRTPFTADTTITKTRSTNAAVTDQVMMEQINDCANDAQNMKVACTENKTQPIESTLESTGDVSKELSMQLDGVQTSLNNLKELMHSGGLALDMDTLYDIFNDDPGDYNNPIGNSNNLHRVVDDKVEGNELMCNQPMFDFNDLLQNDWCQPTTSYHTIDADYCNLNTPQINESGEETPPTFPPAKKIRTH